MANYNVIGDVTEIPKKGRCSVISTDTCSTFNLIPEAVVVDTYQDGVKLEKEEQYFETSGLNDDILRAKYEKDVFVLADTEGYYNTMKDLAQEFRKANGNYDVFADRLDKRLEEMAESDAIDNFDDDID